MRSIPRQTNVLSHALAALVAASFVPTAHAYCYIDNHGFERCTLSTAARVGIGIGLVFLVLGAIAAITSVMKRRRAQRNATYITQQPGRTEYLAGAPAHSGYQPGYDAGGYGPPPFDSNGPQYPPKTYGGYDPNTGFAPPPGPPPQYAYSPPPGPPPAPKE